MEGVVGFVRFRRRVKSLMPNTPPLGRSLQLPVMNQPTPPNSSAQASPCTVYHTLATTALLCLIASLIVNLFVGGAARMAIHGGMGGLFISGGLMLVAVVFGVIALCGIRRYGPKCLLWEGLVSVLVPILVITFAIPVYRAVRMKAQNRTHTPQHQRAIP